MFKWKVWIESGYHRLVEVDKACKDQGGGQGSIPRKSRSRARFANPVSSDMYINH